jgi:formaldehyde-activating enzyme involved in methanogenesis
VSSPPLPIKQHRRRSSEVLYCTLSNLNNRSQGTTYFIAVKKPKQTALLITVLAQRINIKEMQQAKPDK